MLITQAIAFVLDALFHLFILAALVRFWMQAFRAPEIALSRVNGSVTPLRLATIRMTVSWW